MLLFMNLVSLLAVILQFFPEGAAAKQTFTSKPSNPTYGLEGNNLTLEWSFTPGDGGVNFANVIEVSGSTYDLIGRMTPHGGFDVKPRYVGRVRGKVSNSMAEVTFLGMKRSDKGIYRLDVYPVDSGYLSNDVSVIVQFPASFTYVSGNQTVPEGTNVLLFCNASGSPLPIITWVKVLQDRCEELQRGPNGTTLKLDNIHPTNAGTYKCIAYNKVGDQVSHTLDVAVSFLNNRIIIPEKYYVGRGQTASLKCQAVGYPQPTITWSPCSPKDVCDNSFLNVSNVQTANTSYTCEAGNSEGHVSANTTLIIGGRNIYLRLMITDEECIPGDQSSWEKLKLEVDSIFTGKNGYNETQLLNYRCGSIIVDLVLKFNTSVAEDFVISTLRNAIKNGKLGDLSVNVSSIEGISPVNPSTAAPPTSGTTSESNGSKTLTIVLAALGVFVGVIIIAVAVKRRLRVNANDGDAVALGDSSRGTPKNGSNLETKIPMYVQGEVERRYGQEPGDIQCTTAV